MRKYFTELNGFKESLFVKIAVDKISITIRKARMMIREQANGKLIERKLQTFLLVQELWWNLFSIVTINDKKFSFHA